MQRFFLKLGYNGSKYHGWQKQENAISVQQLIEEKLELLFGVKTDLVGCGRTDTGVHASFYIAHFDANNRYSLTEMVHKLNAMLPKQIVVYEALPVRKNVHARFDAISRSYQYFITRIKDPFNVDLSYVYNRNLDIDLMNICSSRLLEFNDFKSFCKVGSDNKTTLCDVKIAFWEKTKNGLVYNITADRFLRNMVRAIVGTLLQVGEGKLTEADFIDIINGKDRSLAGTSAPASGLFLSNVEYPEEIWQV